MASLVHAPIQWTDRLASMIYVLYRLGERETAVRDHSRRFENDTAFLPSPRLDFNDSFATKRDTGWPSFRDEYEEEVEVVYQRNGFRFFSSRGSLCSNEPRRFTGGRAAEIASFSFLFPFFQMTTFHVNHRILHSCGTYFRILRSERRRSPPSGGVTFFF